LLGRGHFLPVSLLAVPSTFTVNLSNNNNNDSCIQQKAVEKKEKYTDLRIKVQRVWKTPMTVVPIIIGALGSIYKELEANLQDLGVQKSLMSHGVCQFHTHAHFYSTALQT